MEDLTLRIRNLQEKSRDLDPSERVRNRFIAQISGFANEFIANLPDVNAYESEKPDPSLFALDRKPVPLSELIEIYSTEVAGKGINPASGGHLGFIPGGGLYASALADFLVDITNEYAGIFFSSPGSVTIENELLNWLKSIFRFPESSVGNLSSGGSIATMIAFTAARDKHRIKSDRIASSVVYVSPQVHHCVNKALRIIGLEDIILRQVELDAGWRINPELLVSRIEADKRDGLNPFMVVGSAGTTDTGAVDPLAQIGAISRAHGLWYHIDAAYGGFFILTDEKRHLFNGIETADSLVVDPHKGLFLPFGIGAVLVKDREAVYHSHHYFANYMQDANSNEYPVNPADVSPELTKHFRGLRMWLPLKLHGLDPFIACLEEKLLLTEYFRNQLMDSGFEVGPTPDLSVSYFWYPSKNVDQNQFNEELMKLIHKDGRVFLSSTKIDGKFVIRVAILSFRTKLATIDRAVEMIEDARNTLVQKYSESTECLN